MATGTSRRRFLIQSVSAAGGLTLAFSLPGCGPTDESPPAAPEEGASDVTAWLSISTAGLITIRVPSSEMGQGVLTALPMIIAEELDADWTMVRSETAPHTDTFVHPVVGIRGTGGSSAVRFWWPVIAQVGATARAMLVQAAADSWGVSAAELSTGNSVVRHAASGKQAGYGELANAAGRLAPPKSPTVKTADQYRIIGTSALRLDAPAKVNGSAIYGIDVTVPDMVYATTLACPTFVGELTGMDEEAALAVAGVERVVRLPLDEPGVADVQPTVYLADTVAVVADSYWHAHKGMQALNPQFSEGGVGSVDTAAIDRALKQALDGDSLPARDDGNVDAALAGAAQVVTGEYSVPYLAHLTLEPMNCTAHYQADPVNGDRVELWVPTQAETHLTLILGRVFGIAPTDVTVHTTLMGGGLGRRYEADVVVQAARLSKAVGRPVKLLWSREEDVQHDYYRPASASRFSVGLDATGLPVAWKHTLACPSVARRNFAYAVVDGVDGFSVEGARAIPYAITDQRVSLIQHDPHVPAGSWRSVGNSHNGFYVESMVDEVAQASGQDPFALRRRLLAHEPRFLAVLDELESRSNWREPAPPGHFRGMAIHRCFKTIVGEVVEVSVASTGNVTVHRVTCVADCGRVVNPGIIEAQLESSILDGVTAALWGGVIVEGGRVAQSNFHDYRFMRLREVPELMVHILESEAEPGGAGEPAVPPSMPALASAVSAATGQRVRALPIERVLAQATG